MNISSLIISLIDKNELNLAIKNLEKIKNLEIITHQDNQIIVVLETANLDEQIKIFKKIQSLENVKEVSLAYSYDDSKTSQNSKFIDEILNENLKAGKIKYNGNIKI